MLKKTLGEFFVKYRIRVTRGATFTSEIEGIFNSFQKGGIIILLVNTYTGILIPVWVLPLLWFIQKTFEFTMGFIDEKYLHWWQYENRYTTEKLNPFNQDILRRLTEIESEIKKQNHQ